MTKDKDQKNKIIIHEGHKLPSTRRDFLKYGIIPFAATAVVPGFLTQLLLGRQALAQEMATNPYIPFMVFDMAGGASLPGNFLVGKKAPEDLLKGYGTLGWDPRATNALDKSFGVPMAANNVSRMLVGIQGTASREAQANLRMGTFCHFSQDDSNSNRTSALSLISQAGLKGKFIQNGVGSQNSLSGGNSDVALKDLTLKPLFIQNVLDIQGSVGHGPAFQNYSDDDLKALAKAIHDMSAEQISSFEGLNDAKKLASLSDQGYKTNLDYGRIIQELDPRTDQNATQIYNFNGLSLSDENGVFGSVVYNVLKGHTGPGCVTIGACDYHDGNSIRGDQKDQAMGQQIGRAVELAHRMKTPFFFQLITDGGVSSDPGTRNWRSDSNVRSLTVIGFYDPKGAPQQKRLQVGEYTDNEVVNQGTLIGDEPSKVANAVLANYLSACGKIGEFEKTAQIIFRNADLDSVLIF